LPEFPNPEHEPGMERRLIIAFVLTFLVILASQPLLKKYLPTSAPAPAKQAQTAPSTPTATPTAPATAPPTAPPQPQVPVPATGVTKQATAEAETVIENDDYRITFTNRGAQVKSWILKKFDDEHGQPLDLVNNEAAQKYGYPLSLWTYDENLRNKLKSALYVVSSTGTVHTPATLTFEYADQDVAVRKTFKFDGGYVVDVETNATSKGSTLAALPMWPAGFGDETNAVSYHVGQFEYQNDSKIERVDLKKISSGNTLKGPFAWVGAADQYFAAVFIPSDPQNVVAVTLRNALEIPKNLEKPNPQETVKVEVPGVAVGNLSGPTVARLFVGPKSLQVLEAVKVPSIQGSDQDLRGLVNFGFFNWIARPLFVWLKWTYTHMVPNWGWAIVIQTFIITVALLPLRISSMKSALKMAKIQPQMNAIKEKYKKYSMRDPKRQEMNQEIAALMKQEKVSPVGGCLPLVIQMPFLFAYYSMLGAAIDLRHAPWLWIRDLSSSDPYYILPVLLVVSMVVTQRMTPQAVMDPAQQKMMNWMMPLFMGFIFFNLAAGLNLYYGESNLIMIAQQAVMNRTKLGREMREIQMKRARKKGSSS
jgi:YidC/Oxa1 family membrane protein insertase